MTSPEDFLRRPPPVLTVEFAKKMATVGQVLPPDTRLIDLSHFKQDEASLRPAELSSWYAITAELKVQEIAQLTSIINALNNARVRTIEDLLDKPVQELALIRGISELRFGFVSAVFGKNIEGDNVRIPLWNHARGA
jgi:hypothetical protein